MAYNESLVSFSAPQLEQIGDNCLENANKLISFIAPKLTQIGNNMLRNNTVLEIFYAPNAVEVGSGFLCNTKELKLGQLKSYGSLFLFTYKMLNNIRQEDSEIAILKINNR